MSVRTVTMSLNFGLQHIQILILPFKGQIETPKPLQLAGIVILSPMCHSVESASSNIMLLAVFLNLKDFVPVHNGAGPLPSKGYKDYCKRDWFTWHLGPDPSIGSASA